MFAWCPVSLRSTPVSETSSRLMSDADITLKKNFFTGNEGYVLFNDPLNTFYLRLYGVRHIVKDHSDSEIGNPLLPHGLLFQISSKGSFIFYMYHPIDRITHTTAFVTPVVLQGKFAFYNINASLNYIVMSIHHIVSHLPVPILNML